MAAMAYAEKPIMDIGNAAYQSREAEVPTKLGPAGAGRC
jgi:hypothetical protein